jgi:hypothetical protein
VIDREAVVDQAGRNLVAELIPAVALADPSRAEDRDPVVDVAQGVETALDLVVNAPQAQVILLFNVAGRAQQQLVVPCPRAAVRPRQSAPGGIRTRAARLKRPPL